MPQLKIGIRAFIEWGAFNPDALMTISDYIAIGVLVVMIPLLLRRTFGGKSRTEQNNEKPKD
jgi:hypothetical protein